MTFWIGPLLPCKSASRISQASAGGAKSCFPALQRRAPPGEQELPQPDGVTPPDTQAFSGRAGGSAPGPAGPAAPLGPAAFSSGPPRGCTRETYPGGESGE